MFCIINFWNAIKFYGLLKFYNALLGFLRNRHVALQLTLGPFIGPLLSQGIERLTIITKTTFGMIENVFTYNGEQ